MIRRSVMRAIALGCLALLLTVTMAVPGSAQMPMRLGQASSPEEQFLAGKQHYQAEQFAQAELELVTAARAFRQTGQKQQAAVTLSNLSLVYQAEGKWGQADQVSQESLGLLGLVEFDIDRLSEWQVLNLPEAKLKILAPALDTYGRLWQLKGEPEIASKVWKQAELIHRQLGNREALIGNQINQAQALQSLGLFAQAQQKVEGLKSGLCAGRNQLFPAGSAESDQLCAPSQELTQALDPTLQVVTDPKLLVVGFRSLGDVLRTVGNLQESQAYLREGMSVAEQLRLEQERVATELSLANTFMALGDRERERQESGIKQGVIPWECQETGNIPPEAVTHYKEAALHYQNAGGLEPAQNKANRSQARRLAPSTQLAIELNYLRLLNLQKSPAAAKAWERAQELLVETQASQGLSRATVYAEINLARQGICLNKDVIAEELLEKAIDDAEELRDTRANSYALGSLGGLYEYFLSASQKGEASKQVLGKEANDWGKQAEALTTQALLESEQSNASDLSYRWRWQLARLLEVQNKSTQEELIQLYELASKSLDNVRENILTIDSDIQFSFRDDVEPFYRKLVSLLLSAYQENSQQSNLEKALFYTESLQLSELENFLRCNIPSAVASSGNQSQSARIKLLARKIEDFLANNPDTAFVYPILNGQKLDIILKVKGENLQYFSPASDRDSLSGMESISSLLEQVEDNVRHRSAWGNDKKRQAAQLYKWVIQPIEKMLQQKNIHHVVFIPDSTLRNIPIAALYDEEHNNYWVDKPYTTAIVPSATLLKVDISDNTDFNILVAASAKDRTQDGFSFTPEAREQGESILKSFRGKNHALLIGESDTQESRAFNRENFKSALQSPFYNAVHLAAHGQFSSNPEETFIVTDDSSDTRDDYLIRINEIGESISKRNQLASSPLNLLVLSSCDTARGDNRAVLGIAGIAVKSGAEATIAPLWYVERATSTKLMKVFYEELSKNPLNKLEALRQAQIRFRQENGAYYRDSPYHWAPFITVGN